VLSRPLLLLAAIAARTQRLRLGSAIVQRPLGRPMLIAEEIASLEVLSAGRVELGIGMARTSLERGLTPHQLRDLVRHVERRVSRLDQQLSAALEGRSGLNMVGAINYNTYQAPPPGVLGQAAVMRQSLGAQAEIYKQFHGLINIIPMTGPCYSCHSVSFNGTTMVARTTTIPGSSSRWRSSTSRRTCSPRPKACSTTQTSARSHRMEKRS
jgi:hypothetical protein